MAKRDAIDPVLREQLAEEAARLIADHGIQDYGLAKRKAASRFGVRGAGALPSNAEIEARVAVRQRLFEADGHSEQLAGMREIAAELMDLLAAFEPRLVGPVLAGTVTVNSSIELHLFTDAPEDVADALRSRRYSVRNCQRRYRYNGQGVVMVPGFKFAAGGERIYALTFPGNGLRHAPMSPIDGRPMRRADRGKLLALLSSG
jgi:hypothetical protein